jgi:hypothetical protein
LPSLNSQTDIKIDGDQTPTTPNQQPSQGEYGFSGPFPVYPRAAEEGDNGIVDQTQSALKQPSQGESSFGDSSGPFFSLYSKAAEEEDNKMVERWQKDADGILIFVSPRVRIRAVLCINWNTRLVYSLLQSLHSLT